MTDVIPSNLVAAARELLRLKDLKTDAANIETSGSWGNVHQRDAMYREHNEKAPLAWDALRRALNDLPVETSGEWVSVDDRLPDSGVKVLGYWQNELGKDRRTCVEYIAPRTRNAEDFCWDDTQDDWFDNDESGTSWVPSGWYERVEGDEDYRYYDIPVTHWRPLPSPPKTGAEP